MSIYTILQNCGFTSANHVKNAVDVANQTATLNQIRECAIAGLEADVLAKLIHGKSDFLATTPINTGTFVSRTLPVGSGYDDDENTFTLIQHTSVFY